MNNLADKLFLAMIACVIAGIVAFVATEQHTKPFVNSPAPSGTVTP